MKNCNTEKVYKIFVYGTLQKGMYNERYMKDEYVEDCQNATTKGDLYMVKHSSFPAIVKGNNVVKGELYTIRKSKFNEFITKCDVLEGHPTFYKREKIKVIDESGNEHVAYCYTFIHSRLLGECITTGDYKEYFNSHYKNR